jgi:hypothetical protein
MAFSQDDLTRIRTAIARGEREVQFGDRRVVYRSIDELMKAEQMIARSLASNRRKQTYIVADKGI